MKPMELSQYGFTKAISVAPRRINEIVRGKRAISTDTPLRLGRYFGVHPQSWINL
ncbi:HigA family addiction module antidote protein [Candidatus Sumerlaeota bacterium]|nr:HigA family addiction module antidote protein [Candidatus Sumerlaeota bacterium]